MKSALADLIRNMSEQEATALYEVVAQWADNARTGFNETSDADISEQDHLRLRVAEIFEQVGDAARAKISNPVFGHHGDSYPHAGGCEKCRESGLCSVCGKKKGDGCTNGRCLDCHQNVCGHGGDTRPGHGYWR